MSSTQHSIDLEKDINVHFEDRQKSRAFFAFLWILYAVVYLTKNCFNGALSSIVTEGLMTKSQTGLITGIFYLVYAPGQIVGGFVSDRVSPEKLLRIGLLGAAVSNAIIFFNQNYYVMLGAWTFNAIIQFGVWPSVFKIVSSQLVRSDRKQMILLISFAGTGGLVLSYLVSALVSDWRYNFAISAVLLVLFALLLHWVSRWVTPCLHWDAPAKIEPDAAHPGTAQSTMKVFAANGFFFILAATTLSVVVTQSCSSLAPVMLVESYDYISPTVGNLLNIILLLSGIGGTLAANAFIIRRVRNHPKAMALCLLACLPACVLATFVGSIPVASMVALMCVISCVSNVNALIRSNYTAAFVRYGKNGAAAGIINAVTSISFMLAAYAVPRLQEAFGWNRALWCWPILIAVSIPLSLLAGGLFARFSGLSEK